MSGPNMATLCFWFSFLFLAILFTVEIEKVKQLIETCIDSNYFQMTKHENSMFVTIEGNREIPEENPQTTDQLW